MSTRGKVYLVGAGPGDPGLLTLRGAQLLHEADLVLYDYLVNPGVLDHGRHDAEWICLGRHGRASLWEPSRIHAAMIAGARAGKCVVRLKGGDPLVFGRAAGELEALQQAGIPFEIVPGITAGLAAAAYAGLPLTNREMASAVALVTGQEGEGKGGAELDYEALARFPGTIVMYMGVTTAGVWSHQLIHAGMAPETPVLFVRRCSWPNQETLSCRLDEVAAKVLPYSKFPPPAVAIIGEVAIQHKRWGWWEQRPLGGQSVLVTRPRHQAAKLCESLAALGADVVCQPAIEILPPESWDAVDRELDRIHEFDFVVFSSSNGVSAICDRWLTRGRDFRGWGKPKLVAVGPGTAESLCKYHLRADLVPERGFHAERMVDLLCDSVQGRHCLLIRANRGREVLGNGLRACGARVTQVVAYRSQDVSTLDPEVAERIAKGSIDWVLATSSSIARATTSLLGSLAPVPRWASISPITSDELRRQGIVPTVEASEASIDQLIQAIVDACSLPEAPASF